MYLGLYDTKEDALAVYDTAVEMEDQYLTQNSFVSTFYFFGSLSVLVKHVAIKGVIMKI